MFITLFEACHTCYHQLHLYSQTPVSTVPNILACLLIVLWIVVCGAIFICDFLLIRTENTLFRGIVYFIYVGMFFLIFFLFQWIGSDLNNNFHIYLPSMFEQYKLTYWGKIKIIILGAYSGNLCQFFMDKSNMKKEKGKKPQHRVSETVTEEEEPGVYRALAPDKTEALDNNVPQTPEDDGPKTSNLLNPLLARLYRKFIRFLTFRRVAQLLMTVAIGILCYDGLQMLYINPGQALSAAGEYNLNDDALSWLQGLAIVTGIWYCWIPLRVSLVGKDTPESLRSFDTSTIQAGGFIDSQFASVDKPEYDSYQ